VKEEAELQDKACASRPHTQQFGHECCYLAWLAATSTWYGKLLCCPSTAQPPCNNRILITMTGHHATAKDPSGMLQDIN
jgi:hypothetical protein